MGRLDGKVALITGAAAGLGESYARLMAKEGAKVVVTTSNKLAEGQKVADDIKREGGEAIFIKLDVTQDSEWQEVIEAAIKQYGKLNIVVNNAGISIPTRIEDCPLEEWNRQMEVNATGVFLGTKHAIRAMKNNGELCSIVNIASVDAMVGEIDFPAYNASKGAVRSLSKTAALHCGDAGYQIRVNSVYPGYTYTPMMDKEAADLGLTIEQYKEKVAKWHPIGHIGEAIDIAYAVVYLASDESKQVTGAELVVDGGWSAK
jgi:NAD(P)-dependent dehydrogenase (short-subunit alcohol dehydrogenase family)